MIDYSHPIAPGCEARTLGSTFVPFARTVLASAVFSTFAFIANHADAAGLGRLVVQSALGQPLRAEVEVTSVGRDEAQSLTAKVATQEQFRQAGMEYNPVLRGVKISVEKRGDKHMLLVSSPSAINEPFVDLLVELNWATGRFVREYTFLLDPPELKTANQQIAGGQESQSVVTPGTGAAAAAAAAASTPATPTTTATPSVEAAAPSAPSAPMINEPTPAPAAMPQPTEPTAAAPESAATQPAPVSAAAETPPVKPSRGKRSRGAAAAAAQPAAPAAAPMTAASAPTSGNAGTYQVKSGDTLAQIARTNKPTEISLDQAIMSIYRANPQAFFGDINRLRSGAELTLPDAGAMGSVDAAEAKREVKVMTRNFGAYKQRLASSPRVLDPAKAGQSAAGRIGTNVDEKGATTDTSDQLKLSKAAGTGDSATGSTGNATSKGAAEQAVARDAALAEANSRVKELEGNVAKLKELVELKEQSLASLQKQLDAANKTLADKGAATIAKAPDAPKLEAPKAELPKAEAPKLEPPKSEPPKAEMKTEPPKLDIPPPKAEAPTVEPPKMEAPKVEPPKAEALKPVPRSAASESLLDTWLIPGVGLLALLGAGYGFYAMRKRKKVEKFEDSLIAADAFTPNSLFGSTGGQSVDTNQPSSLTRTATTTTGVPSTEVDPIAEAEVYIAYGREQQAEEILREALKRQPERQGIRLKLAEIYSSRKDAQALSEVAAEMYMTTHGENEEWAKIVQLGMAIDPDNPLYGGSPDKAMDAAQAITSGGATVNKPAGALGAAAAAGAGMAAATAAKVADFKPAEVKPERFSETKPLATAMQSESSGGGIDFDLNLDTKIKKPSVDRTQIIGAAPSADLPTMDFGKPSPAAAKKDNPLDFEIDLPGSAQGGSSDSHAMDLSSIGLSLEPSTTTAGPATETQSPRWQEMATKLDLASAYEEIGDKEGARELLQEVLRDGDKTQKERAKSMMAKIA